MLDASVTLVDVVDRLRSPVGYLRKALDAIHVARRRHPDAVLRIGRKGDGAYPNFRTDADPASRTLVEAFNGRSYGPLTGKDALAEENWSDACIDLAGVQALMREVGARHLATA